MTAPNYPNCYSITRQYEGGNDDDPQDPGGRTSRGIIQREYDKYRAEKKLLPADVWKASEAEIADIYRTKYWDAVLGDQWPDGADLAVWDCGVNSGPERSRQFGKVLLPNAGVTFSGMAASCKAQADKTGFIKAFCKKRLSFVQGLKTFARFGGGWTKRIAGIEASGVRMSLVAEKTPAPVIKQKLEAESKSATASTKKSAGGAAAGSATAGTPAAQSAWDSMSWDEVAVTALVIIVGIGITAWCIHWALAHRDRATAYAEAAKLF